jgi:hypothetical protein
MIYQKETLDGNDDLCKFGPAFLVMNFVLWILVFQGSFNVNILVAKSTQNAGNLEILSG